MDSKIKNALECIYNESVKISSKGLEGHIKNENGIVNDYRGRAIYEFFQNAIDRAENKIWIHLDKSKRTLTIANDGKVFSIEKEEGRNYSDLESLCSINTSSKNQNESIGNKGVGFKSGWEYTSNISVCSTIEEFRWGFEMHNPFTLEKLDNLNYDIIKDWLNNDDNKAVFSRNENKVPSFYFPLPVENAADYFDTFKDAKTIITFHDLKEDKIIDIETKIKEFSEHQIFFVNQLEKLKKNKVELELKIDKSIIKTLNTAVSNDEWLIVNKSFEGEELLELQKLSSELNYQIELPKIAIAFPLKQGNEENEPIFHSNFYCYLPTEIECGFNVLIHGDFLLDVSRKQIDFGSNRYNKRLLEHIVNLFVGSLSNCIELHHLPYFGKFLLPTTKVSAFEKLIQAKLYDEKAITEILKKVYTKDRDWNTNSYKLIFNVLNKWKRNRNYYEREAEYYSEIYNKTIIYFCNPAVYIVPITENESIIEKVTLPQKDGINKLFFRKENIGINGTEILEKFESIAISNFDELESLKNLGIVKDFREIEILRAINSEIKENKSSVIFESVLSFVISLNYNFYSKNGIQSYLAGETHERQLAKIYLPCKDGEWHPAIKCFVNIKYEIYKNFNGEVFELDIDKFNEIGKKVSSVEFDSNSVLGRFGVWDSKLPILYDKSKYKLPFKNIPKLENNELKFLISKSCNEWNNLNANELRDLLNTEEWFYDSNNKSFICPSQVFLFNDNKVRKCIAQEKKNDLLKDLYSFFNIRSIEDTDDHQKLVSQLERMKDSQMDDNHKTIYKQIVFQLSKNISVNHIPLLTTQGNYINTECWFASNEQKKYTCYFKDYNFVNFDSNTSQKFVENLNGVKLFDAEYNIKPAQNELKKDNEIKKYLEDNFLPYFFVLAENALSSLNFDRERCIARWNQLEIHYAEDVWLEISFNGLIKELYKDEKKDVLYKPVNKNATDSVGILAHDLVNSNRNPNFYKFGYAIAEAVFRNQNFGEILSNFILKAQSENNFLNSNISIDFLSERGITSSDIKEVENFIKINLINANDLIAFIGELNKRYSLYITIENWRNLEQYYSIESFNTIDIGNENDKFKSLLNIINPEESNKKYLSENKEKIQLEYFTVHNSELSEESFQKLSNNPIILSSYDLLESVYIELLIDKQKLTEEKIRNAKVSLEQIHIARKLDIKFESTMEVIVSNSSVVKVDISSEGKSETHTTQRTAQERENSSREMHERGNAHERILALKYANEIADKNQFESFKKKFQEFKKGIDKDNVQVNFESGEVRDIAEILQVSKTIGDGLGFDLLEPSFIENQLDKFNFIEVKSSQSGSSIHLSEPERQKILYFAQNKDIPWKLYHFVNGNYNDRTDVVLRAVNEHAKIYNGEQLLIGNDWIIHFNQ